MPPVLECPGRFFDRLVSLFHGVGRAGLGLLRILGDRGHHERLERACVDLLAFVNVDRPARVAFQAGIEKA